MIARSESAAKRQPRFGRGENYRDPQKWVNGNYHRHSGSLVKQEEMGGGQAAGGHLGTGFLTPSTARVNALAWVSYLDPLYLT